MKTSSRIISHIRKIWQFNIIREVNVTDSLLNGILDDFLVIQVTPLIPKNGVWAYLTSGVSSVPAAPFRSEFILLSPRQAEQHLRILTEVAFRHAIPGNPLQIGDTISLDRSWLDESLCTCLLVSRPYILNPAIEFLELDDIQIRYQWLLPITPEERAFVEESGLEALERLFEQHHVQPLDPSRNSVV